MTRNLQYAIMFWNVAFLLPAGILFILQIVANGFVALALVAADRCTHGNRPKLKVMAGGFGKAAALVLFLSVVFFALYSGSPAGNHLFVIDCR